MTASIKIKTVHQDAIVPEHARAGDAGVDLHAIENVTIAPGDVKIIGTGLALELPDDLVALVHSRSGLAAKQRVAVLNAPGVIDSGYRGEVKVILINHGIYPFEVKTGDRIAQLVIQHFVAPTFEVVDELSSSDRGAGGFGSTGTSTVAPIVTATPAKKLSKRLSHALRHAPDDYGITLDAGGWADLNDVVVGLRLSSPKLADIGCADVQFVVDHGSKERFELAGGRIRATYGHSVDVAIDHLGSSIPSELFHGTSPDSVTAILADGLRPMTRRLVHLSGDEETAERVGRRKHSNPAILRVDAAAALRDGHDIRLAADTTYTVASVPAAYITRVA